MDSILKQVWFVAKELGKAPERILEWQFRAFVFWVSVAQEQRKDELLLKGMTTSAAVWDNKKLIKLLDIKEKKEKKTKEQVIKEAVQKAKKFKFRPASVEELMRNK